MPNTLGVGPMFKDFWLGKKSLLNVLGIKVHFSSPLLMEDKVTANESLEIEQRKSKHKDRNPGKVTI